MAWRSTGDCASSIRFGSGSDDAAYEAPPVKPAASPPALRVQAALGDRFEVARVRREHAHRRRGRGGDRLHGRSNRQVAHLSRR